MQTLRPSPPTPPSAPVGARPPKRFEARPWHALALGLSACSELPGEDFVSGYAATGRLERALVEITPECGQPFIPPFQIQGASSVTPWRGETVVTEGMVVGEFLGAARLGGFFLQDPLGDGEPATSDGVFVFVDGDTGSDELAVRVGDRLRVVGVAQEYFGQTEIAQVRHIEWCGRGEVTPRPLWLLPAAAELESYEGMLVRLEQPLTLTGSGGLGRYGELLLSAGGRLHWTQGEQDTPGLLLVDDGSRRFQPRPVPHLSDDRPLRLGDVVPALEGVIGSAFGSFRLHPTEPLEIVSHNSRPSPPPSPGGYLRIAAFNLENYFLRLGLRGARTASELAVQRARLVLSLAGLDADIVGLVELENDGGRAGEDLVAALNTHLGAATYARVRASGAGGDAIRVGLIYKPERVTRLGPALYSTDPVHARRPLAQTFRWGSRKLTVAVAHFKSKSCAGADGLDLDVADGSGCFGHRRLQEAHAALGFLQFLQHRAGDSALLFVGDLNAYPKEASLLRLGAGGLVSLLEGGLLGASGQTGDLTRPYSYVFDGRAGLLDHVLGTPGVAAYAVRAGIWHINADEPPVLRDLAFEADPVSEGGTDGDHDVFRSSDHDPVFVDLAIPEGARCEPSSSEGSQRVDATRGPSF